MTSPQASRNYYDVLHVSRDAPVEIIRSSYRTLMQRLRYHPDLGGDAATAALINEAYAALTDDRRRVAYDASIDAAQQVGASGVVGPRKNRPTRARKRPSDPFRECVFCQTAHDFGNAIHADAECAVCNSPLRPSEKRRLEDTGNRAVARVSKRRDITYYTHWPQSLGLAGRMEEISLQGMRLMTNENLAEGQYIKIVGSVLEAVGVVTYFSKNERCGASGSGVAGVSFVTVRFMRSVGAFVSDRV